MKSTTKSHTNRRIFVVSHTCYLDTYNGASVATRSLSECLSRHGFVVEAMSGTVLEAGEELDLKAWLGKIGLNEVSLAGTKDVTSFETSFHGIPVTLHISPTTSPHLPDESERDSFLRLFEETVDRFRPEIVVNYGGDLLATHLRRQARDKGAAVVFPLHNFAYRNSAPFADTDAVIVPSRFAASYYRKTLGLECKTLPNLIDFKRIRADRPNPRYVTFVNPSHEKGVYAFARIADEIGRRRPDIPLLVVEGRGTERTLVDCGIDLRSNANVYLMSHTSDPRQFWGVTRICVMPSLWWENQSLVAIEAMANGIPVIGSDRGGIPETLGDAGIVLGLPSRMTQSTRDLPSAAEVEPWLKCIFGLWDDPDWYARQSRRSLDESRRWASDVLEPQYVEFFEALSPRR